MHRTPFLSPLLPALCVLVLGCTGKDDTALETTDSSPETQETGGDTQDTDTAAPCGDGAWGLITHAELAIHVSETGAADGAGTMADPISDLAAAIELSRDRKEDKYVAIWPGIYSSNLSLSEGEGDSDLVVQGCSAGEVFLDAAKSEDPVVKVSGATGVGLEGLCTRGGTRGFQLWEGADVSLSNVTIQDAVEVGLLAHGNSVRATLDEVSVTSPDPTSGGFGYGIALQQGATVEMTGGGVWEATGVGILIEDVTQVTLSAITVDGTSKDASDMLGRGLQVQADAGTVSISGSSFTGNHGAGIFAMTATLLELTGNTVDGTDSSAVPDSKSASGDGVVITRGAEKPNPAHYIATLDSNVITNSARAAILFDGVTATSSDTKESGNGYAIVSQGPATVKGGDTVTELSDDQALDLNFDLVESVELGTP